MVADAQLGGLRTEREVEEQLEATAGDLLALAARGTAVQAVSVRSLAFVVFTAGSR